MIHLASWDKHRLYSGALHLFIKSLNFTPNELHTHLAFYHWLQCESQCIEVGRLHICPQDAWSVLKELLGVNNGDMEPLLQLTANKGPRELATNDQDTALFSRHDVNSAATCKNYDEDLCEAKTADF